MKRILGTIALMSIFAAPIVAHAATVAAPTAKIISPFVNDPIEPLAVAPAVNDPIEPLTIFPPTE